MRSWNDKPNARVALLAVFLLWSMWGASAHAEEMALEYKVKAAFVHNFIPYIRWPEGAFSASTGPIRIGVLGSGPLARAIPTLNGKRVAGRRLEVLSLNSPSATNPMHILVVCATEKDRYPEILNAVDGSGVLTIGNSIGFSEAGGVIGFYLEEGKVRFTINLEAARRHHLKISSKLLRLATIVP